MICFEVWLNGKRVCVAGVGADGVLTTTMYGIVKEGAAQSVRVNVGGVDHSSEKRLAWLSQGLGLGDSLMVKVVDLAECDEPSIGPDGAVN